MIYAAGSHLFRTHIGERAGNSSSLGDTTLGSAASETKVHDANSNPGALFTNHHDVLGFDITVNNTARVTVFQCFCSLNSNVQDLTKSERRFALERSQGCSLDDGHDKEQ